MTAAILIIILGAVFAFSVTGLLTRHERRLSLIAFALHVVSSFGQYALQEFFYGISDAHGYMDSGETLARLLDLDFIRFAPE